MKELRFITKHGEKYIGIDESQYEAITLPAVWNEEEVKNRLVDTEYYIERDYTETIDVGVFRYNNAVVYVPKEEAKKAETLLVASYEKTQEEYQEQRLEEVDPIRVLQKQVALILTKLETLEKNQEVKK